MMKCDVIAIVAKLNAMSRPGHGTALSAARPNNKRSVHDVISIFVLLLCGCVDYHKSTGGGGGIPFEFSHWLRFD